MRTCRVAATASLLAALLVASADALAETVPALQDLVGARGSSGEIALSNRGYTMVGVTSPTSPVYWREPGTGRCVGVRTSNGRVKSVAYEPAKRCEQAATYKPLPPKPGKGGFSTVCGVTAEGKEYRYQCTVDGVPVGQKGTTTLHFPDNRVALAWLGGDRVRVTFVGMVAQDSTFVTTDGVTKFTASDKPYFFVSDRAKAAAEIKQLK